MTANRIPDEPLSPDGQRPHKFPRLAPLMTPALVFMAGLLVIVVLGLAQRVGWLSSGAGPGAIASGRSEPIYTCPMHPQIRQPGEGRCPICGMELVTAAASGAADQDELSINIEPAARRLANIQTDVVRREPLVATIETVGAIAKDESRVATIASYTNGRLERLFADYTGVEVAQGDHLAVLYSPDLYAAQVEYLESRQAFGATDPGGLPVVRRAQQRLVANSRKRLLELGMTADQIAQLEQQGEAQSRLTIYAPTGGTVISKPAVEGKYVTTGETIYRIADLSTVWLMLELFPEDAAQIRYGQAVDAQVQSIPGEAFHGRVAFIDPMVDRRKRTVGVRVEFLNDDGRLRPGDYATATVSVPIGPRGNVYDIGLAGRWISPMHPQIIRDTPGKCPICGMALVPTSRYGYSDTLVEQTASLYVPRSAVLMAGNHSVVYVETEPGRFQIRPVTIGPILRDQVVIADGLEEGETVATSGNFLIDSQMQLAGNPSLIDPTRAVAAKPARNTPLEFEHVHVETLSGETGHQLEQLYTTYFSIQQALAHDRLPKAKTVRTFQSLAQQLRGDPTFPASSQESLRHALQSSKSLEAGDLEQVRTAFKPVSHAVVKLAAQVRGRQAEQSFTHFFCPHVQSGGGDWLQANDELINPYYGSQMLRCGNTVQTFPLRGHE